MTAERVRAAFRRQAAACRELGSPFTALVCDLCAERLDAASPAGAAVLGWPGDPQEDAADWLERRLAAAPDRAAHVVYHTIVRQYLAPGTRDRIGGAMEAAGARADAARPLAWLRFEPDGASPGAALALTLRPGGETRLLARGDFHGRWVDWRG